jgi:hypothetical protein
LSASSPQLPSFLSSSSNPEPRRNPATVARTGVRVLGELALLAFVVTAWLMATHALHTEQRQQQQMERLR